MTAIDPAQKTVQLDQTESLAYDYLVIAMGGKTPFPNVPGVKDYAIGFRTLEDAYRLKQRLQTL